MAQCTSVCPYPPPDIYLTHSPVSCGAFLWPILGICLPKTQSGHGALLLAKRYQDTIGTLKIERKLEIWSDSGHALGTWSRGLD